jgi:hypothetical protein
MTTLTKQPTRGKADAPRPRRIPVFPLLAQPLAPAHRRVPKDPLGPADESTAADEQPWLMGMVNAGWFAG